jgi:phosphatidylglycerophosphatase A
VALALLLPGGLPWHLAAVGLLLVVGVPLARFAEKEAGRDDPGSFVLDEIAGYVVALLGISVHERPVLMLGAAFVLFRCFDVLKPWPCRKLEHIPGGWGVMADDLMAGVYANLALRLLLPLF